MIPKYIIHNWREKAPWQHDHQIEQDIVISRALIELYNQPVIRETLAFRGGTAFNKLFMTSPSRYSEDLDFVQINDEPIGKTLSAIRNSLDPWLGKARWKQNRHSAKLFYRFDSEDSPPIPLRLKVEINTAESFSVYGHKYYPYTFNSDWFDDSAQITSYSLEELMATKLRALYQRLKGRDLYDIWLASTKLNMDCHKVIDAFIKYNKFNNTQITRAQFEENLHNKMQDKIFLVDIKSLLPLKNTWDIKNAYRHINESLIPLLPGDSWKINHAS